VAVSKNKTERKIINNTNRLLRIVNRPMN